MSTNKVVLRTVEQVMNDYTPIYQPLYPLFLGKSQQYVQEVGKLNFKRINAIGDIRAKHITPKDTEIHQISANESTKTFKKYFLANQYTMSHHQGKEGVEPVIAQVLDEHQRHMDDLFLLGEGTSGSNMVNNGLFWSDDDNYTLETSDEVEADGDDNYLTSMHNKVITTAEKSELVAGRKVVLFYGTDILPLFNSLYLNSQKSFKSALGEVLGSNYTLMKMPADVTPNGENGWLIANLDQVKMHYTVLPSLKDQGSNDEKMYYWFNFLMGASMLEVLVQNAIVRQPTTLES